jgi:hypothetical protein
MPVSSASQVPNHTASRMLSKPSEPPRYMRIVRSWRRRRSLSSGVNGTFVSSEERGDCGAPSTTKEGPRMTLRGPPALRINAVWRSSLLDRAGPQPGRPPSRLARLQLMSLKADWGVP